MWAEGGKKPSEVLFCGSGSELWLMLLSLHTLINEEQLHVENRMNHTKQLHTCMQNAYTETHRSIKVHPLEMDGRLACSANKQVVDWTFVPTHIHLHRWWSELPCCEDSYQSWDIKLNWQTGSCTVPTLQSAALCRVSAHVSVHGCLIMLENNVYKKAIFACASVCISLCSQFFHYFCFGFRFLRLFLRSVLSPHVLENKLDTRVHLKLLGYCGLKYFSLYASALSPCTMTVVWIGFGWPHLEV